MVSTITVTAYGSKASLYAKPYALLAQGADEGSYVFSPLSFVIPPEPSPRDPARR